MVWAQDEGLVGRRERQKIDSAPPTCNSNGSLPNKDQGGSNQQLLKAG